MKVVINKCYGGFGLSPEALLKMYEYGCEEIAIPVDKFFSKEDGAFGKAEQLHRWRAILKGEAKPNAFTTVFTPDCKFVLGGIRSISRNHPILIRVVEELGDDASGRFADLTIVNIPDDVKWEIAEYDGNEHIAEVHRTWG
jgi:hypothetical protein